MELNLYGGILNQVIYTLNINSYVSLEKLKEKVFPKGSISNNILKANVSAGTVTISFYGYIILWARICVFHTILNIETWFYDLVKSVYPCIEIVNGIQGVIKVRNIQLSHQIKSLSTEHIISLISKGFNDIRLEVRSSNCTETPFMLAAAIGINKSYTYQIRHTGFHIKIYPSGKFTVIANSFRSLQAVLDTLQNDVRH